jgi:sRNA-binding regulator protein Hfq
MARDLFHEAVRQALEKDGWTITDDPYQIRLLGVDNDIDLGAERIIGAQREGQNEVEKIAVEIKSFLSASFYQDFHGAVGQFSNYKVLLEQQEADRVLYLAVPHSVYVRKFSIEGIKLICSRLSIRIITYDPVNKKLVVWER